VKTIQKPSVKTSEKILILIERNSEITLDQISESLQISKRAVENQMKTLRDKKIIIRFGFDRRGIWKIIKK
jgi:predicted ArsR family transcriptional regulator